MKGFIDFIRKGNLVQIAVAFVMGAAFAALTTSFTTNFVSPLLGLFGGSNLANRYACLKGPCEIDVKTGTISGVYLGWGAFVTALISFLLTALVIYYFVVKPYEALETRLRKDKDAEAAAPTELDLLTEIRDALKGGTPSG